MSTEIEGMMTVDRVAEVTGLTRALIYRASELRALGAPAHFIYADGVVVFRMAGLCQLAEALQVEEPEAAKALAFELQRVRARASGAGVLTPDDAEAQRLAKRWDKQHDAREDAA